MEREGEGPRISVARIHRLSARWDSSVFGCARCGAADKARMEGKEPGRGRASAPWAVCICVLRARRVATRSASEDEGRVGGRSDGDSKRTTAPAPDTVRAEGQCRCQNTFERSSIVGSAAVA